MTQCAKIIVGFMANVSNVFYPTFTDVFLFSPRFFTFFNVFYFHLNVYYVSNKVIAAKLRTVVTLNSWQDFAH